MIMLLRASHSSLLSDGPGMVLTYNGTALEGGPVRVLQQECLGEAET